MPDYAELWLKDSLLVLRAPVSSAQISVDMSESLRHLESLRRAGVPATTTHLLVAAGARALAAQADLLARIRSRGAATGVSVGLSVSGETFLAPVMVIDDADSKTIAQLVEEIRLRVPHVQTQDRAFRESLRRWGWMVPFSFLRKALLSFWFGRGSVRRALAGDLQVSTVPTESAETTTMVATGVLIAGRVRSLPVAVDGQTVVRPMMTLTFSSDHRTWDGRAVGRFLSAVQQALETAGAFQ